MYPAAWEQVPAPACAGALPRPLVYAVGGVDGRDFPLESARPGGRPTLAAPGFAVPGVMALGPNNMITGPFTGSSVAAATASGVAAAVWQRSPGLTAAEVIDLLHTSAVASPEVADFCLTSPCGLVRRISLCRALEAVTGTALACTKIPFGAGVNPAWSAADRVAVLATAIDEYNGTHLNTWDEPPICDAGIFVPDGLSSFPGPYPCPSETLPNAITAPAVGPQPLPDPCPACLFDPDPTASSILVLAISDLVPMAYPQTMTLQSRATGVVARYDIESARTTTDKLLVEGLAGGQVYRVLLPSISHTYGSGFDYATIEWVNTPDAQTTSALVVSP